MPNIRIEAVYDRDRGRTVLYDYQTGTVLFEATEESLELVDDPTEMGLEIARQLKEFFMEPPEDGNTEEVGAPFCLMSPAGQPITFEGDTDFRSYPTFAAAAADARIKVKQAGYPVDIIDDDGDWEETIYPEGI